MKGLWFRVEKRTNTHKLLVYTMPAASVALALGIGAVLLVLSHANPIEGYSAFFLGAFGSVYGGSEILVCAIPLTLCGLAVMLPLQARLWNIGAEGQLYMGALGATIIGLYLPPTTPAWIFLGLSIITAFLMGAIWGLIPGLLKAKIGVNEVISTLMLNYVTLDLVDYLVHGPLRDPHVFGFPLTPMIAEAARFTRYFHSRLHSGIFIALAAVIIIYFLVRKTLLGYELRFVGANPKAAITGGIDQMKVIVIAMLIAGGLAGLAGMGEIDGVQFRLRLGLSPGYGYTAIPVALVGQANPIGILGAALLFGTIYVGGAAMQQAIGIPVAIVQVIQALIILFLIAGNFLVRYRIRTKRQPRAKSGGEFVSRGEHI